MAFFIGLISFFGMFWLLSLVAFKDVLLADSVKAAWAAGTMFTLIGISHFAKPEKLEGMMPENWPRRTLNYLSGAAEVCLGMALFFPESRYWAAWGLIILLIAVFPANIYTARIKPTRYNISRLFFQPVYIAWVVWAGGLWLL